MDPAVVYLSLGSNLGNRHAHLQLALAGLAQSGVTVLRTSSLYETEPQDVAAQPWFLNQVVECQTELEPVQLLKLLQDLETRGGRVRADAVRRGPRVIDIDILLYGGEVIRLPHLIVPHPRMTLRRFVLEPLLELVPDLAHPETGDPLRDYLPRVSAQQIRRI